MSKKIKIKILSKDSDGNIESYSILNPNSKDNEAIEVTQKDIEDINVRNSNKEEKEIERVLNSLTADDILAEFLETGKVSQENKVKYLNIYKNKKGGGNGLLQQGKQIWT